MALPEYFCWSRFGTEAGQAIAHILERKEQERTANAGMFLWGIGNAIGPSVQELLRRTQEPEVLFSPIKSSARPADTEPQAVVAWTYAETLAGDSFALPTCSLVTSRRDPLAPRATHYALVCFSADPLDICHSQEKIAFACLRNLLTGRPVGASQVTAVVEHKLTYDFGTRNYDVAIRTKLVYPYFLRLRDPLLLSKSDINLDWSMVVRQVWERRRNDRSQDSIPRPLPVVP
jgi:hypothetical protein